MSRTLIKQPDNDFYILYTEGGGGILRIDLTREQCMDKYITDIFWQSKEALIKVLDEGYDEEPSSGTDWCYCMAECKLQELDFNPFDDGCDSYVNDEEAGRRYEEEFAKWLSFFQGLTTPEEFKAAMDRVREYMARGEGEESCLSKEEAWRRQLDREEGVYDTRAWRFETDAEFEEWERVSRERK